MKWLRVRTEGLFNAGEKVFEDQVRIVKMFLLIYIIFLSESIHDRPTVIEVDTKKFHNVAELVQLVI